MLYTGVPPTVYSGRCVGGISTVYKGECVRSCTRPHHTHVYFGNKSVETFDKEYLIMRFDLMEFWTSPSGNFYTLRVCNRRRRFFPLPKLRHHSRPNPTMGLYTVPTLRPYTPAISITSFAIPQNFHSGKFNLLTSKRGIFIFTFVANLYTFVHGNPVGKGGEVENVNFSAITKKLIRKEDRK